MTTNLLDGYLEDCRALVRDEIRSFIPRGAAGSTLYELMLEYPGRSAKALRPSLCIAICRALGGRLEDVLRSAAVIELYHNAFLIHDDIEDESLLRRGLPTLHRSHGVPVAINVGDGMLALSLQPLLENTRTLGLGKALRILEIVARMSRESVEGQAMELDWIRANRWDLGDRDYRRMAYKKTCWYTFVAPVLIGAVVGGALPYALTLLRRFAMFLGVAFQIQDDVLNLESEEGAYGKELAGDLWEGKHTLIVMHAIRSAAPDEQEKARRILAKPRTKKSEKEVRYLLDLIHRRKSLAHAREVAAAHARRAESMLRRADDWLSPSSHRDFLGSLTDYVIHRDR